MKINETQMTRLRLLAKEAIESEVIKRIKGEELILEMLNNLEKIHLSEGDFSPEFRRAIIESIPFDLPFYQYIGKVRKGEE